MKEAYLYKKLKNKIVQCRNCAHYCVIKQGERGICGVRENIDGKLYALNYGKAIACNIDPIEKKPLFHFLPGTQSLSIATVGCNFRCANCQNYDISQMPQLTGKIEGEDLPPKEIVKIAKENNLPSIAYTYTSPTIFSDYALDTMKLAKKQGIKNVWVSNGFWSKELFEMISPFLDAANIDLKSFEDEFYFSKKNKVLEPKAKGFYRKYCGGRLQPVLDTLKRIKQEKIWLEVTTLAIPTLSDSKEMFENIANFIKNELSAETPWHISQFSGTIAWKLKHLPDTPVKTLKMAYEIGKKSGLKYVYTGNVPGLKSENTYCPKCGTLAIERLGYTIKRFDKNGKCAKCSENLDIIE